MGRITLVAATAIAALVMSGCAAESGTENARSGFDSFPVLVESVSASSAAKQSTHLTFTLQVAGQSFQGSGDLRVGDDPAVELTTTLPQQGELTIRLVADAVYVKFPTEFAPGKPWAKFDANSGDLGVVADQVTKIGDPARTLKQFEAAGAITDNKQEELNGRPTTHYSAMIDIQRLAAGLSDPDVRQLVEQARQAAIDKFPIELWVDPENLPARMTMDTPFTNPTNQQSDQIKLTIDYSDWGKPVDIAPPPPEQVTDLPPR